MKIIQILESKPKLTQAEIDKAFDNFEGLSPKDFHTTFIEYFDQHFTDEQVDAGEMDEFIGTQWERFKKRRGH